MTDKGNVTGYKVVPKVTFILQDQGDVSPCLNRKFSPHTNGAPHATH